MKLNYYPETDSLYIDLSELPSVESREISEGVILDYDADGRLVGIDIDNASHKVEMQKLILNNETGVATEHQIGTSSSRSLSEPPTPNACYFTYGRKTSGSPSRVRANL